MIATAGLKEPRRTWTLTDPPTGSSATNEPVHYITSDDLFYEVYTYYEEFEKEFLTTHKIKNQFEQDIFRSIKKTHAQSVKKIIIIRIHYPMRLLDSKSGYKTKRMRKKFRIVQ